MRTNIAPYVGSLIALLVGCRQPEPNVETGTETTTTTAGLETETGPEPTTTTTTETGTETGTQTETDTTDTGPSPDLGEPEPPPLIDILVVVDNTGTMGEEQAALAAALVQLPELLGSMVDIEGSPLDVDVNVMVTSTDVGHPYCGFFEPDGYDPLAGQPQTVPCIERLDHFTGLGSQAPSFPESCTDTCSLPIASTDPFIHWAGPANALISNVPDGQVGMALGCIGPQGINGCAFESPLEAMYRAVDLEASWNTAVEPFIRDSSILALVFVTDEADCSVESPGGYQFFTNDDTYWEINPETMTKTQPTSAVCWNGGVDCGQPDMDGVYADCMLIDTGVLFPVAHYTDRLEAVRVAKALTDIVVLGIVGVPAVTAHNPAPPFEPTAGGVDELVYRQWRDGVYPDGDILPFDDYDAAQKEFQFGIGPGCTGGNLQDGFTGQAIPSVRLQELCESLDGPEQVRCCLESVCDDDYTAAFTCLRGMIQTIVAPSG